MTPVKEALAEAGNPQRPELSGSSMSQAVGGVKVGGSQSPATASPADDAGWRCPVCGAMAGAQDLDDDPDLPCWDCQQEAREAWGEFLESQQ